MDNYEYILWLDEFEQFHSLLVGEKGVNLGKLIKEGITVPQGFTITSKAYHDFIEQNGLDIKIKELIKEIDYENTQELQQTSEKIRNLFIDAPIPQELDLEIERAYLEFCNGLGKANVHVAVRSSTTSEDLPNSSYAGQQETYLFIKGIQAVKEHIKKCWASLWNSYALFDRHDKSIEHFNVTMGIIIQQMINSKKSGVVFTANPINNENTELLINASWGLGEAVVAGMVTPDEYIVEKSRLVIKEKNIANKQVMMVKNETGTGTVDVHVSESLGINHVSKQCLTDTEIIFLSQQSIKIEKMCQEPQDIEWVIDENDKMYILQTRPITTLKSKIQTYDHKLETQTTNKNPIVQGLSASPGVITGTVKKINQASELEKVAKGDIIVTPMTTLEMIPAMRKISAIVTNKGGRTSHAAIIARELGIPCIVGTNNATNILDDGMDVTVDATKGFVYKNESPQPKTNIDIEKAKLKTNNEHHSMVTATKMFAYLSKPALNEKYIDSFDGFEMNMESIFSNVLKMHPTDRRKTIEENQFIQKLSNSIKEIANEASPRPIFIRFSELLSKEDTTQPSLLSWRGTSKLLSTDFIEEFKFECRLLKHLIENMNVTNINVLLPFVRTISEVKKVKALMSEEGLIHNHKCNFFITVSTPSIIFQIEEFSKLVDGFSIEMSNLTHLIMGSDRDHSHLEEYIDVRNEAVKNAVQTLIIGAHQAEKKVSINIQNIDLYPEFTEFLIHQGIDSITADPTTISRIKKDVFAIEQKMILDHIRNNKSKRND